MSYVYETETGLYYLQSRYYNPEIGRFINADGLLSTGQGILGNNMFAYCLNNPVALQDPAGEIAITALILIGSAVIGAGCAGYTAYTTYQAGWDTADILWYTFGAGLGGFLTVYTLGMSAYQVYLNFCMINGITPVTDIGSHNVSHTTCADAPQTANNPLKDITYTEKVQQQKQQADFHGFPDIVDNYGGQGYQQEIIGGDGNMYTKLVVPGSYLGNDGAFVYIWNEHRVCNHRCFETCYVSLR